MCFVQVELALLQELIDVYGFVSVLLDKPADQALTKINSQGAKGCEYCEWVHGYSLTL